MNFLEDTILYVAFCLSSVIIFIRTGKEQVSLARLQTPGQTSEKLFMPTFLELS